MSVGGAGNITDESRAKYFDANQLNQDEWAISRLYAFFERPNAQLRRYVRESLAKIKLAASVVQDLIPAPGSGAPMMEIDSDYHKEPKSFVRQRQGILDVPQCIAMHVRNNDFTADRGADDAKKGIERGLAGHVKFAKELRKRVGGTLNIFLATDNASVVHLAATKFPEFQWITQLRPMSSSSSLFQMFTEPFEGNPPDPSLFICTLILIPY